MNESEPADVERMRARPTAGLDDALAAVAGGTAVVAVMAAEIVPVTGLGGRRSPRGIADDRGCLA
jgi:hypothetical protein